MRWSPAMHRAKNSYQYMLEFTAWMYFKNPSTSLFAPWKQSKIIMWRSQSYFFNHIGANIRAHCIFGGRQQFLQHVNRNIIVLNSLRSSSNQAWLLFMELWTEGYFQECALYNPQCTCDPLTPCNPVPIEY